MRRRVFIIALGTAAIWPFATRAQKSDGVRRVGVIMGFAENDEVWPIFRPSDKLCKISAGQMAVTFGSITGSAVKARSGCAAWQRKL